MKWEENIKGGERKRGAQYPIERYIASGQIRFGDCHKNARGWYESRLRIYIPGAPIEIKFENIRLWSLGSSLLYLVCCVFPPCSFSLSLLLSRLLSLIHARTHFFFYIFPPRRANKISNSLDYLIVDDDDFYFILNSKSRRYENFIINSMKEYNEGTNCNNKIFISIRFTHCQRYYYYIL